MEAGHTVHGRHGLKQKMAHPVNASEVVVRAAVAGHVHLQGSPKGEHPNTSPRVTAAELSAITFLGTSSAQPQPGVRNMSSLAVSTAAGSCKCPCGGWGWWCVGGAGGRGVVGRCCRRQEEERREGAEEDELVMRRYWRLRRCHCRLWRGNTAPNHALIGH